MLILRTMLSIPGNQERKIDKARQVPADVLRLDLEDSVPVTEKESARKIVTTSITQLAASGRTVFVRINSLPTPFAKEDIRAVVMPGLKGICLPKSESADDMRQADVMIIQAEKEAGLQVGAIGLVGVIESPKGVINAYEIARACPRIIAIAFGAEDYALEMGIDRTREGAEISYPRMAIAVACHAVNVVAIDCVYPDVRDKEGLIADTKLAKQMGFQGKLVIHPDQVEPVNQIFVPSEEEIAEARRIVAAFDAATKQGLASVSVDNKMVDTPVAERARLLLARAGKIKNR
ncbi:MAG: CoA ester lyase [Chloroflexota bacterium]